MKKIFLRFEIALLFLWSGNALAQLGPTDDHLDPDFLQPQITAGFSASSVRDFRDVEGTFGTRSMTLGGTFPLYQIREGGDGALTSYFLLGRGQLSSLNEDISFLPAPHTVYKPHVGVTAGIATTNHHLYLLTVGVGFSEDQNTAGSPKLRATGSLLGKYQLDPSFAFIYGLSYSYVFNRGLLLPILGTHASLGDSFTLHLILPFSLGIDYREGKGLHFGFVVRASGDQIHIDESDYFGTQTLPLYMKIAQVQSGFGVAVLISERVWIQGEAGVLSGRQFAIGTVREDLVSSTVKNSGYSSLRLKFELDSVESWAD